MFPRGIDLLQKVQFWHLKKISKMDGILEVHPFSYIESKRLNKQKKWKEIIDLNRSIYIKPILNYIKIEHPYVMTFS